MNLLLSPTCQNYFFNKRNTNIFYINLVDPVIQLGKLSRRALRIKRFDSVWKLIKNIKHKKKTYFE